MGGYSDASLANRPDASSTGGHIFGFMRPEDFAKGTGKPRSSLSAEVQSLADLEQEMMLARLTWRELLGMEIALKNPASAVRQIPAAMIIDAKAGYDVLDRDAALSASVGIKDKYSTLKLLQGTLVLWCDSDRQLADGLTKSAKQDVIKNFLVTGTWTLHMDGAFISARKRKSMSRGGNPALELLHGS